MVSGTKLITGMLSLILLCTTFEQVEGTSVYVIADTDAYPSTIEAYDIQGSSLLHQATRDLSREWAIGIAIDPESELLFVTFEASNEIELVSAKTLEYVDTVTAAGASNLAGIVVDSGESKVYIIDREEDDLYVYSWNPQTRELTPDFPYPYYVELQDCYQGYGLALDEGNDRLYVGDRTKTVKYYSTNSWSKLGQFSVSEIVVGIAVDGGYVYTGSAQLGGPYATYLTKYDLSTGAEDSVDVGAYVLGIAVGQHVYLTTFGSELPGFPLPPPFDRLMVYNSDLEQLWYSDDIGSPAGVAVAGGVSYKPALFDFEKTDDVADCVAPYDYFIYTITYGTGSESHSNVRITDHLPFEVEYDSSDPPGSYDPGSHTVTWEIPYLGAYVEDSVTVTVQVNEQAEALGTLTNFCEIESDIAYNTTELETSVCCWNPGVVYVDKDATGSNNGMSWEDAYTRLQDALEKVGNCYADEIWVAEGTYNPAEYPYPWEATFELVNGVGLYGGFTGSESSRDERDWTANETILTGDRDADGDYDLYDVVTALNVDATTIVDGFTIEKGAYSGIWCDTNGSPTIANNTIKENKDGVDCGPGSNPSIMNCIIEQNDRHGILCLAGSSVTVTNSVIQDNGYYSSDFYRYGIYCKDNSDVEISRCKIAGNNDGGIYCSDAETVVLSIKNSWIYENGNGASSFGIYLHSAYNANLANVVIRNDTIADNMGYGIGTPGEPIIRNCIIWGNSSGSLQYADYENVTYSCVEGEPVYPGNGNINTDPSFVNSAADDYHVTYESSCYNMGDPSGNYGGETDIDGNPRVMGGRVDIGADEDYPHCVPQHYYDDWVAMGRPDCWCSSPFDGTQYQCDGDADGKTEGWFNYRIYGRDLNLVVENWKRKIDDLLLDPCADIDHEAEGFFKYRVYGKDLAIVVDNWKKKDHELPNDCADCGRWQQARAGGEVSFEELLRRLAEIWLDAEVREVIDEDTWLKWLESLKRDMEKALSDSKE